MGSETDRGLSRGTGIAASGILGNWDRDHAQSISGRTLWLTGLSGAGKTTLSNALKRQLDMLHVQACVIDGDRLREGVSRDLGFSQQDRFENVRRAAEFAKLLNEQGLVSIVALISPLQAQRDLARQLIGADRFSEVYVQADLALCQARDPKGLYALQANAQMPHFTGISSTYEPPTQPELMLDTSRLSVEACVAELMKALWAQPARAAV